MKILSLELWLAWSYLRSKKKERFISIISIFSFFGIMLGVATLIVVMSVMNGFRQDLVHRILGINSHISVYFSHLDGDYKQVVKKINDLPNVNYANVVIENEVMISSDNSTSGAAIKALNFHDLENKSLIKNNIKRGVLENLQSKNNIIIGAVLARKMNVRVGDELKIIAPQSNTTIIGNIPRIKTYIIGAIFETELYQFDASTIFMKITDARKHFQLRENYISLIEVFSKSTDAEFINIVEKELQETLFTNGWLNFHLQNWRQANDSFIEALNIERTVMFFILTLIIIVAAFNIISSLIMLVNDKNKNISCLRTMGMGKASIMRIFIICGSIIGFIGTLFGVLLGYLFAININHIKVWLENLTDSEIFNPAVYFLSNLPSEVFISDVILISSMSFIFSILATIYPSYKASNLNPVEILRYE
jgi:lipoprotein-releasing system permease protein